MGGGWFGPTPWDTSLAPTPPSVCGCFMYVSVVEQGLNYVRPLKVLAYCTFGREINVNTNLRSYYVSSNTSEAPSQLVYFKPLAFVGSCFGPISALYLQYRCHSNERSLNYLTTEYCWFSRFL